MTNRKLTFAKQLRCSQTKAEHRLWYYLRGHRFLNLKFRRQVPIGNYIADFVCFEYRLIVEVDGGQHAEQVEYDKIRDQWFRTNGYAVLRFWNADVMKNLEAVLRHIQSYIESSNALSPDPSPSLQLQHLRNNKYARVAAGRGEPQPATKM